MSDAGVGRRGSSAAGAAALAGWVAFFQLEPRLLEQAPDDGNAQALVVLALAAAIVTTVVAVRLAFVRSLGAAASRTWVVSRAPVLRSALLPSSHA